MIKLTQKTKDKFFHGPSAIRRRLNDLNEVNQNPLT